jgi:ADP-ribose pyrophosphatase YjhB (NUDIX family)
LREETGLEVLPGKLLKVTVGKRSVEFVLQAECDGEPEVRSVEIIEARFWERTQLPDNMLPSHRETVEKILNS